MPSQQKKIYNKNQSKAKPFIGFHPPTSNTTYTPNQFFDVCIPNYSRGVVRLVGYMLRKTLGWCDEHGNPKEEELVISYNELIKNAKISRGAIKEAINDSIKGKFIKCLREGKMKKAGEEGLSALFQLNWDCKNKYTFDPAKFNGFFAGQGNRTYIPNQFFDVLIKEDPLKIIKLVGTIIRNTIGFQTYSGFRRQNIQMNFLELQKKANLSSRHLSEALVIAIEKKYIKYVEKGIFDKNAGINSRASKYSLNWTDSSGKLIIGSKGKVENNDQSKKESEEGNSSKRTVEAKKQSKKDSGFSSKGKVVNASKKDSASIKEIKPLNKTFKQQPVAVAVAYEELIKIGFNKISSLEIVKYHTPDKILRIITNQIDWLPNRNVKKNKLGLLKKAIKENWTAPEEIANENLDNNNGSIFTKYFYAGCAGSNEEPVTEPTDKEIFIAEKYVGKLLKIYPNKEYVAKWGKLFGEMFKSNFNNSNKNVYISLIPALRSFGDKFYLYQKEKINKKRAEKEAVAKEKHQKKFQIEHFEYLRLTEEAFKEDRTKDYQKFLTFRNKQREEVENTPFSSTVWLDDFNKDETRIESFQKYFPDEILDFWEWDQTFNVEKLNLVNIR